MERENQLLYLQQQTKEQSTVNSSHSVAISLTENNLEKLNIEIGTFYEENIDSAKESAEFHMKEVEESEL